MQSLKHTHSVKDTQDRFTDVKISSTGYEKEEGKQERGIMF